MAFVDELEIFLSAGKGGDGVVRFLREKSKPWGGPAGGDGGKGGDIVVVAKRNLHTLAHLAHTKELIAENGIPGGSHSLTGAMGKDLIVEVPVGTILFNKELGKTFEFLEEGETKVVLRGGEGGLGNEHFKSSTNRTPKQFTKGKPGESSLFDFELRLIADVGLVGLPNAGKSSLLNSLTNAQAKVGNYPFTTLEPNLGAFFDYVIADIPGLIEGAHEGKGLGDAFLRHVRRTRLIVHLVAADNEHPYESYKTIRGELEKFDSELAKKQEIIVVSTEDAVSNEVVQNIVKELKTKTKNECFTLSLFDDESVKNFRDSLVKILHKQN